MNNSNTTQRVLWIFDFDGTLSEFVADRNQASLHPMCLQMLSTLSESSCDEVAILSSRRLVDLIARIPFRAILLAASSGLELRLPDGEIVIPSRRVFQDLELVRAEIIPIVRSIELNIPRVDVEDKLWSVTVHYRQVSLEDKSSLQHMLTALGSIPGIQVFEGAEAIEVMMVPRFGKSAGLRKIAKITGFDRYFANIVFAGDDENDASAMKWLLRKGGRSLMVGNRIQVKGALVVPDPSELAATVMSLRRSLQNLESIT